MITFARWAARSSTAAAVTGTAVNVALLAFLAQQIVRPGAVQVQLGSLSGLLGGVSAALMIPVAVTLGGLVTAALGVAAMAMLAIGGFMLAGGVLSVPIGFQVVAAALVLLAVWLLVVSGQDTVPPRAARFGRRCGVGVLVGAAIAGASLLLPWMSWPQLVVLGVGAVPGLLAWLAIPAWFLRMGRVLAVLYHSGGASRFT